MSSVKKANVLSKIRTFLRQKDGLVFNPFESTPVQVKASGRRYIDVRVLVKGDRCELQLTNKPATSIL